MNTSLTHHLGIIASHVAADPALTKTNWDGAVLEVTFADEVTGFAGNFRTGSGLSQRWEPTSQLLKAAVSRLRRHLPRSARRALITIRPDADPCVMVLTAAGPRILPDELDLLRMNPPEGA